MEGVGLDRFPSSGWARWLTRAAAPPAATTNYYRSIWISDLHEGTYYGPYTNVLPAGTRVLLADDYALAGGGSIAKASSGIVKKDPAWDEDSCDPDRVITVALSSGQSVSVPRRILHR